MQAIYSAGFATRPKKVATVSPVIGDDAEDEEHESPSESESMRTASKQPASPFRVNQEYEEEYEIPESMLQAKSSVRPQSSSRLFGWGISNQDMEAVTARPTSSASSEKYAVLGQKAQWRKKRSHRRGGAGGTIRHVTGEDDRTEEREELGERASSFLSSVEDNHQVPVLSSARSYTSQHSSRESSQDSSRLSSGRRSESPNSEHDVFVVTRQKSKYAAKLYLPGQNPLYLGRYRSEEAARSACENAFTTITTPRK